MFRSSNLLKCLMGIAILAACSARLNADVMFTDNFDTGYTTNDSPLIAPWVDDTAGPGRIHAMNNPAGASSDPWCAQAVNGGYGGQASVATGVASTDTSIVASFAIQAGASNNSALLALSSSANAGGDGMGWRTVPGSFGMQWISGYGFALYSATDGGAVSEVDYQGVATALDTPLLIRVSIPNATGAQTAVVDWKRPTDVSWTNVGSIGLNSSFRADYLGLYIAGSNACVDDVHFESQSIPEPSSIALLIGGLIGLVVYAWRRK